MVWKGVIIEESLEDKSLLELVKIIKTKKTTLENESERGFLTFYYIEVDDKDKFVEKAIKAIKGQYYIHICQDGIMIVIYKNKAFEFSSSTELNKARDYGLSIGIIKEQLSFEELINDPYC